MIQLCVWEDMIDQLTKIYISTYILNVKSKILVTAIYKSGRKDDVIVIPIA